jgi:hypothetical protein
LYSSPNIIGQIKSRRIKWAGHVARMGDESAGYKVSVGKPEGKRPLENRGVDGRIRSECILGDWLRGWSRFNWLRIGTDDGLL